MAAESPYARTDDVGLVIAIARYNGDAFAEAYRRHAGAVFGLAQRLLWELMLSEDVEIADLDGAGIIRARALMEKYHDLPMDLADASLVAVAEQRRLTRVLTLDAHFRVYRPAPRATFEVLPAPS